MFKYPNCQTTSGKVFLRPPSHFHLSIRDPTCLHIHLNLNTRMELMFHTTSGASRSRPPHIFKCRCRIHINLSQATFIFDQIFSRVSHMPGVILGQGTPIMHQQWANKKQWSSLVLSKGIKTYTGYRLTLWIFNVAMGTGP